jgi:RimJ/RimL family protein N-acetyltransferase
LLGFFTNYGQKMRTRHVYYLDLSALEITSPPPTNEGVHIRPPRDSDKGALAELMIDAYRGTIDYDGETVEDAAAEVQAYFSGLRGGEPLLNLSRLAFKGESLISACLAAEWDERQHPLIAYVMTGSSAKNLGVGKHLVAIVLLGLLGEGYREVGAVITEGNLPSERLFGGLGFKRMVEE